MDAIWIYRQKLFVNKRIVGLVSYLQKIQICNVDINLNYFV